MEKGNAQRDFMFHYPLRKKSLIKYKLRIFITALCSISLFPVTALSSGSTLTFGIVPQQAPQKLALKWTPITKYLSKKSGLTINFSTAPSIPDFEKRCLEGAYDIAYMNPYHYVVFHETSGYEAFARQKDKKIQGIVVVQKYSPINKMKDLDGTTMAFPSPAAFAATLLQQAYLKNNNIKTNPKFVKSHDSVYMTVSRGFYPSGGGVSRTFNNADKAVTENLRILWKTKKYTPHAIAAHPTMAWRDIRNIQKSLLEMNIDPKGQALLQSINFNGFSAAVNSDWNDVRELKIRAEIAKGK